MLWTFLLLDTRPTLAFNIAHIVTEHTSYRPTTIHIFNYVLQLLQVLVWTVYLQLFSEVLKNYKKDSCNNENRASAMQRRESDLRFSTSNYYNRRCSHPGLFSVFFFFLNGAIKIGRAHYYSCVSRMHAALHQHGSEHPPPKRSHRWFDHRSHFEVA